jgi:HTH-type transcriptional regulator, competence development regulator
MSSWRRRQEDEGMAKTLGEVLKQARENSGLSLRDVERRTGIRNAHLSQIENGTITRPEMAILWELASLYGLDYTDLLRMAGHVQGGDTSGRQRQRMTVAMRAMGELSPKEQAEVLDYMARVRSRRAASERE